MKPYITFSGTASVGKTTLVKALFPELEKLYGEKVVFITEVARSLERKGFKINKEATSVTQRLIEDEYIRLDEENKNIVKVADRSIIDRYSYTILNGGINIDATKSELLKWYDTSIESYCMKYSNMFYIPLTDEVKLELDGVRSADEAYRHEIDRLQRSIIDTHGLNVVTLKGTTEERIRTVLKTLEKTRAISLRITH